MKKIIFLIFLCCVVACAGKQTVSFSLEEGVDGKLSLVDLGALESEGEVLTSGAIIDTSRLSNKAVRVASPGKASFWFILNNQARDTQIKIRKLPSCGIDENNKNRSIRFLLKAYQALYANDFNSAVKLSETASNFDPALSAPHIISGLSYLKQKKFSEAKASFLKAQALDPEDREIEILLKTTP